MDTEKIPLRIRPEVSVPNQTPKIIELSESASGMPVWINSGCIILYRYGNYDKDSGKFSSKVVIEGENKPLYVDESPAEITATINGVEQEQSDE
jgi:hypothetical protein